MAGKLVVHNFSISLDGFGAGPDQSLDEPLGVRGEDLHEWIFATKTGAQYVGRSEGAEGVDDDFMKAGFVQFGAWIMGRNMFTAERGPWTGDWRGWWGDDPPYHCPVFVLTHHERWPVEMDGGTTFHFVTGGPEAALERARAVAGEADIRVGGGAATIRQYLRAGLIDEMHIAVTPILLGSGERLFEDVGSLDTYRIEQTATPAVTHYRFVRA